MAALSVVPTTPSAPATEARALTLYAIEEHLAALMDTTELVPGEEEQAFLQEFSEALIQAVEKRDRVGHMLAHLENLVAFSAAEIKRLQERKQFYERGLDRLEGYAIRTIQTLGKDGKGKWKKLEGQTVTFSLRNCPKSVNIVDEQAVPAEFKTVTVTLPLERWEAMLESLDLELLGTIVDAVKSAKLAVSKTPIKAALEDKRDVPGAVLIDDKVSLVRK